MKYGAFIVAHDGAPTCAVTCRNDYIIDAPKAKRLQRIGDAIANRTVYYVESQDADDMARKLERLNCPIIAGPHLSEIDDLHSLFATYVKTYSRKAGAPRTVSGYRWEDAAAHGLGPESVPAKPELMPC